MSKLTNKQLKIYRYLSYWLYVLTTLLVPIVLIGWQFKLFKEPGPSQLTAYGIIAILIVAFVLRSHIKRAITEMQTCVLKTILINLGKLVPWIVFLVITIFFIDAITKIKFILFWSVLSNFIAMFLDIWHTTILNETDKRKKGN